MNYLLLLLTGAIFVKILLNEANKQHRVKKDFSNCLYLNGHPSGVTKIYSYTEKNLPYFQLFGESGICPTPNGRCVWTFKVLISLVTHKLLVK